MHYVKKGIFYIIISFIIGSCYPRVGKYYIVKKGDTLSSIASKYNLTVDELVKVNRIKNSFLIRPGERIYIPYRRGRGKYIVKKIIKGYKKRKPNEKSSNRRDKKQVVENQQKVFFIMPIKGRIIKKFGFNGLKLNKGIDILAEGDMLVRAAERGKVIYEGEMEQYKKIIIISHNDKFASVYANNEKNLVRLNQIVKRGEIIAEVNKQNKILHFEVRYNGKAVNPEKYLKK